MGKMRWRKIILCVIQIEINFFPLPKGKDFLLACMKNKICMATEYPHGKECNEHII